MTLCEHCDGAGWRLWWDGKPTFVLCAVCDGAGTIMMHFGAVGIPTMIPAETA